MLAPPTITAAMTTSSAPKPAKLSVPLLADTFMRPATVAQSEDMTKARMRTALVAMPASLAACRLPPVA